MQKTKKSAVLLLVALCCLFSTYASAAQPITVIVNGKALSGNDPAVIVNGSVMLPFRAVLNALGVSNDQILWSESAKSIEVQPKGDKNTNYIFLLVGSNSALINSKFVSLNAAPFIQNGKTYVPVRFVAEALGAKVQWNANTRTVTITK